MGKIIIILTVTIKVENLTKLGFVLTSGTLAHLELGSHCQA